MEKIKLRIMASQDWSMRHAMREFVEFADPVVRYGGKEYKLDLGRIIAEPILCGSDISDQADVVVDRTIHWNDYYKCWAHTAQNCGMRIVNNSLTFANLDKHSTYDLMARAMHSADRFPTTVLLPDFQPYTAEQWREETWQYEQSVVAKNTRYGWDPTRTTIDTDKVDEELGSMRRWRKRGQMVREQFYPSRNYLADVMEQHFGNRYPVYLKKAFGGGGSDVYKIESLEELYRKYDASNGKIFHIQEAVEDYEVFIRCMGIGPMVMPMIFQPDHPLHEHYSPDKLEMDRDQYSRLEAYVRFVNSYHRWTYNSYECLVKDGRILPIDFANACPDSNFTSLHTHFPWLIKALVQWFSYIGATRMNMRIDLEQEKYAAVLNDPDLSAEEKFEFHRKMSEDYFEIERFEEFCADNFSDIDEKIIAFYDDRFDDVISLAIEHSDFPDREKSHFFDSYKERMDTMFRPNAEKYLATVVFR